MHDEDGFLSAIRQTPADNTARLVFADWLDEQDDPTCKPKAEFIRLELRMAESPEKSLNRIRWLKKLQKLAAQINPSWLAVVSHPKLEACRLAFQFECPKQWEQLTPTDEANVRYCDSCKQNIHYCDTLHDAQNHARRGNCVTLSLALVRKPNDLRTPPVESQPLTPAMIERLRVAGTLRGTIVGEALPYNELPPAQPTPQWSPLPEEPDDRPKPRHRKKRRLPKRNIQRENWEDM